MTLSVEARPAKKRFAIGTLGWTADDLDDPRIEKLWERGRYEIVEGVLTEMPAARYDTSQPLLRLLFRLQASSIVAVSAAIVRRRPTSSSVSAALRSSCT